jgi:hypothetical protein
LSRRVLDQEVLVLQVMGFHLKFSTVANCSAQLTKRHLTIEENVMKKSVFYSLWLIQALYRSVAILIYTPQELSVAVIDASLECPSHDRRFTFKELTNTPRDWYKAFMPDMTQEKIMGNWVFPLSSKVSLF